MNISRYPVFLHTKKSLTQGYMRQATCGFNKYSKDSKPLKPSSTLLFLGTGFFYFSLKLFLSKPIH